LKRLLALGAWGLGLGAWGLGTAELIAQSAEVRVAAAVSLSEAMQEIAAAFEKQRGIRVSLNLAASNALARQIAAGARTDVFLSADVEQVDVVAKEGLIRRRVDLLVNQLAVAVRTDSTFAVAGASDLLRPEVARIAIGDPAGVPAGVYAKDFLERAGLWTELEAKIVPTASVRAALAALESGDVDAAIVYRTDVAVARNVRIAFPSPSAPRVIYPAALLSAGPEAERFFEYIQSAEAAAIFQRHGFGIPCERMEKRNQPVQAA
jgi:molybdate transport system substrate-binding protein